MFPRRYINRPLQYNEFIFPRERTAAAWNNARALAVSVSSKVPMWKNEKSRHI